LDELSHWFDGINSQRLPAAMDNELEHLYENGDLQISPECYERLKHISPATIDRLRAKWGRQRSGRSTRGRTKPGTLLKSQIPVRTWADWNEDRPGFTEMDLVAHDGGNPRGEHAWTLDFTDIKTGWTECAAVRNKAQLHVFAALRRVRERLPFPLLGVDSDNGSEFINYINFFLPTTKVKEKIRQGSKVKRVYDEPQTPYARVLASPQVSRQDKAKLRATYKQLDLVQLKRQIDDIVDQLWDDAARS
jgi:hypothetical protein